MKTIKTLAIGLAAVAVMSVTSVRASFITTGDTWETHSWATTLQWNDVNYISQQEAFTVSGDQFENPGFSNFSDGSWANVPVSATHIVAGGNANNNFTFNVNFLNSDKNVVFDIWGYLNGTVVAGNEFTYSNGGLVSVTDLSNNLAPTPVPEPTTMIAGALLLLPFGASTLRILRKRTA
jgi:hypothetical protein